MPNTDVRCLLIPIGGGQLLLPSAVVAEVSPYNEVELVSDKQPKWLLGFVNWRNQPVPLLSIEDALSLPVVSSVKKFSTVILYSLESTQTMPFYAFRSADIPRSIAVTEESLTNHKANVGTGLVFKVKVGNVDTVWLPDLNYMENLLIKSSLFSNSS